MGDAASISFLWPTMLWLLVAVPVVAFAYTWLSRRRRAVASRFAGLLAVGPEGAASLRRRHRLVVGLWLVALTALVLAIARPHAALSLPSRQEAIMLAMDVSGSMRATDVQPNRLAAAQAAAKTFVAELPRHVRLGVVAIAGTAAVAQSPTTNREDIAASIDRFQLQRGTALGSGIIIALATLLPNADIDIEKMLYGRSSRRLPLDPSRTEPFKPVPPGSNTTAAIVLLSDGQRTTGPDALEAAKLAADHGVRVYTVGIGTPEGATLSVEGWSMRVRLDEDTMKRIAATTHGEYFRAGSAAELRKIYRTLGTRLVMEKRRSTEITGALAGFGALCACVTGMLSLLWFNRLL